MQYETKTQINTDKSTHSEMDPTQCEVTESETGHRKVTEMRSFPSYGSTKHYYSEFSGNNNSLKHTTVILLMYI